jgi:hypothetical protein
MIFIVSFLFRQFSKSMYFFACEVAETVDLNQVGPIQSRRLICGRREMVSDADQT